MSTIFPIIVLKTEDEKGFFFVDGNLAAREEEAIHLPIGNAKTHCLQFFPLDNSSTPVTMSLQLNDDSLVITPESSAKVVRWPNYVFEIRLWKRKALDIKTPFPQILDSCTLPWHRNMHATLFWENGLYVAIEDDEGHLILGEHLSDNCTLGKLVPVSIVNLPDILVIHGNDASGICAILKYTNKPELYFCESAQSVTIDLPDSETLTCIRNLNNRSNHQLKTTIALDSTLNITREMGHFTSPSPNIESELDLVHLFLDSTLLGLEKEASLCLTPTLREHFPFSVLKEYLGEFSEYLTPPYALQAKDDSLLVGLIQQQGSIVVSRIFEFEIEYYEESDTSAFLINNIVEKTI